MHVGNCFAQIMYVESKISLLSELSNLIIFHLTGGAMVAVDIYLLH